MTLLCTLGLHRWHPLRTREPGYPRARICELCREQEAFHAFRGCWVPGRFLLDETPRDSTFVIRLVRTEGAAGGADTGSPGQGVRLQHREIPFRRRTAAVAVAEPEPTQEAVRQREGTGDEPARRYRSPNPIVDLRRPLRHRHRD